MNMEDNYLLAGVCGLHVHVYSPYLRRLESQPFAGAITKAVLFPQLF